MAKRDTLASFLKRRATNCGLSAEAIARKIRGKGHAIHGNSVRAWLNGSKVPRVEVFAALLEVLCIVREYEVARAYALRGGLAEHRNIGNAPTEAAP